MNRIVALLPLKANSSRVPGKNFKMLGAKPLFRWMLDKLLASELIDSVVINTDASELLHECGLPQSDKLIIRERKPHLCGDEVSMNLVLEDDVANVDADMYLMTHTTNPFLAQDTIENAIHYFRGNADKDSLFTVNKTQSRFYNMDCVPINHDPCNLIPTQQLEPMFEENSCMYLFTKNSFLQTSARIGKFPLMLETTRIESIDIDEPQDWDLAEMLAFALEGKK